MGFDRCKTCGVLGWTDQHKCPPTWQCSVDDPDDWNERFAHSPVSAAEKAAERYWEDEPPQDGREVCVYVKDGDRVRKFRVSASYSLDFNAVEVSP
jgi:hypothetical protein